VASRRLALGSLVRAKTKPEAERVGKYMIRPILALERLTFLEPEGKVGYRWGRDGPGQETEVMDYLEFIARVTSHIPDKGQVMVRYFGLYANAHRGKVRKKNPAPLRIIEVELRAIPSKGWAALIRKPHLGLRSAAMIRKVYEVDPMICPQCGGTMKVVAFLTAYALMEATRTSKAAVVDRIIDHLQLSFVAEKPPPPQTVQECLWAADPPAEYFP